MGKELVEMGTQPPTLVSLYQQLQGQLTPASFRTSHMGLQATAPATTVSTWARATLGTARTTTAVTTTRPSQGPAPAMQVTGTGAVPSGKLMASLGRDQRYW